MRKKLFVLCVIAIAAALLLTACAGVDLTLTFEVDGEVYATVNTMGQEAIQMPKDPEKEGYIFDGWYWDKDVWEKPFTANSLLETPLSENMIVYAKWKLKAETHEHAYGEWEVVAPASCTGEGLQKRVCSVCEEEETEAIPTVPHTYGKWEIVTPATCTAEGLRKHVCSVCEEEETQAIPTVPHTYGKWEIVTPATCTAEGLQKRTCSVCEEEETEAIPKLAHSYETKYDTANHWEECSVCGETSNPEAHTYVNDVCTVCQRIYGTQGLAYTRITNGYSVSGIGSAGSNAIEIPSLYKGEPVIEIGDNAFKGCSSLTSIAIPDSVTSIGREAFYGCSSLRELKMPAEVAGVYGASYVTKVVITGGTSIRNGAFNGCSSLTSITIPNSVTSIGKAAFEGCSRLTSIAIPDSVTSIGYNAFSGCSSLTSIVIPDSVTSIGDDAFRGCSNLTSIAIPDSVTSIGEGAFSGTGIWNNTADNSVVYADKWAVGCKGTISEVTLKADTVGIGSSAFFWCSSLASIEIGNSVTSIGESAFSYCSNLTSIAIPDSVTSIGDRAFDGCSSLTSIAIPDSVTSIGVSAFAQCSSLTSIAIPNGVTSIGSSAFYGCSSLTSIAIPDSVTSIGSGAFRGCRSLTSIAIPDSVTSIGYQAFDGCSRLQSITIPFVGATKDATSNTHFGYIFGASDCYKNDDYVPSSLKEVIITGGTGIGDRAFFQCRSLTSIAIPNSVTSIGVSAFSGTGIWNNAAENSVVYADKWAVGYKGDTNTLSGALTLNADTVGISGSAFSGCSSLTSIAIGNGITSISVGAFRGCDGLETITVAEGNTKYHSAGNCLIETATKTLILGCKNSVIPTDGSVTSIGSSAFRGCSSLTSIAIPDSVTSIGSDAFDGCSSLTKVEVNDIAAWCGIEFGNSYANPFDYAKHLYINGVEVTELIIPDGVTGIGSYAFYGCSSLTSITIPDSVTSIGDNAFYNCSSLTSIAIPDSVTSIGDNAFYYCSNLTGIVIPNSVTSIGSDAFYRCSSLQSITIPFVGATKDGTSNTHFGYIFGASSYSNNEAYVPSSLKEVIITGGTSIGERAFNGCSRLTSITIPDSVTSIGSYAFQDCSSLTGISIPNSVTRIGSYAFDGCSSLVSITIGNGVTRIGTYAFRGCSSLTSITIPFVGATKDGTSDTHFGYIFGASSYSNNNTCVPSSLKEVIITGGTSIGSSVFLGCSSLTSITIPNSVTSIGDYAFEGCSSLTSIAIPDSVTSIGNSAFYGCRSLTSIAIPDSVTSIGGYAFYKCSSLTSIIIPDSVTSIGGSAFEGCSRLTSIAIPDSVTSIGYNAFSGCSSLTSIAIPDSVTSIGNSAFSGCSSLRELKMPAEVAGVYGANNVTKVVITGGTSIGSEAFNGCSSLTSIAIPDSVTSIGSEAFYNCSSLTSITIPFIGATKDGTSNTHFGYIFGASSYSQNSTSVPDALTEVIVTGGTSIGNWAFYDCSRLTSIAIPDSVTSIGYGAFHGCSSLQSITIPFVGATKDGTSNTHFGYIFGASSFNYNETSVPSSLKEVIITGGTSIGDSAFYDCSSLTSIVIPNSVTSIGDYAFYYCSSLQNIEYQGTKAEWKAITKGSDSNYDTGNYTVTCTDGTLTKAES